MTGDEIQELVLTFLDTRGGYVAGASERELFLMAQTAVLAERERCTAVARRTVVELERKRKWSAARAALDILTAIEKE